MVGFDTQPSDSNIAISGNNTTVLGTINNGGITVGKNNVIVAITGTLNGIAGSGNLIDADTPHTQFVNNTYVGSLNDQYGSDTYSGNINNRKTS